MEYLIKPIIKHPYLTIGLIVLITIFLGHNISTLKIDTEITKMLPEGHPTRIAEDTIKEEFGISDMILIGLVTDNIYNSDFLTKVKNVSKKLKKLRIECDPFIDPDTGEIRTKKRRCIEDVISLSTINYIEGTEEGMIISDLMEKVPKNKIEMDRLKERVLSWDFYIGNLVSADSTATSIAVEYKSSLSSDEQSRVVNAVQDTLDQAAFGETVKTYIAGAPVATAMISHDMMKDLSRMVPIVFGVVILFLLVAMRKVSMVLMIFVTIAVTVVMTMGLIAVFGFSLQLMTSSIPTILVAIGSAYSIHIVNHYSDERAKGKNAVEAVENTMRIVGGSVLAAALTTMAG
ncbi:MAG: MMPL family transporter, partial [Deltaproteobacteria bacterium]|nr:MMPL family transporter [Deltaproteobacteria bacterium]